MNGIFLLVLAWGLYALTYYLEKIVVKLLISPIDTKLKTIDTKLKTTSKQIKELQKRINEVEYEKND